MPVTIIGKDASSSSGISSALQQVTLNSVRKILPDAVIERAARHCGHTYRSRVLSPVVTVLHMILASLWPEESFQASLQLLWDNFVGAFPTLQRRSPSSGSLAKARARLLESATANDTDPIGLSFTGALRAILAFAPVLATSPPWKLPAIYDAMLREIASCRVRPRPCRHEPRAVRREWKHYPKLKTTRAEWTRQWAA